MKRIILMATLLFTLMNITAQEIIATKKYTNIKIPKESFTVITHEDSISPMVAIINKSIKDFEPKEVFGWHCSVLIKCKDIINKGMPSSEEQKVLDKFEDKLSKLIIGRGTANAIYLGRITWNGTREIIYLVNNPEKAATKLQALIDKKKYPREFDFSIEPDYNWDKIKWCFDAIKD